MLAEPISSVLLSAVVIPRVRIINFRDFLAVDFSFVLPGLLLYFYVSMARVSQQLVDVYQEDDLVTETRKTVH